MANKEKSNNYGAPSEPVDYSQVPQDSSSVEKPARSEVPVRTGLAQHGHAVPAEFYALEEAGGDLEKAQQIMREKTGARTQDDVNAEADKVQREAMERVGREYHVPGQKQGTAPSENKSATAETAEEEETKAARKTGRKR